MRTSFLVLILLVLDASPTAAAVRTWTGAASGLWSNPANWGGTAPVAGDDLLFPNGAANTTNTNDLLVATNFNSITITGPGYLLSGNEITLTTMIAATQTATVSIPVVLVANPIFLADSGVLTLTAPLSLNGHEFNISTNSGSGVISGPIGGPGDGTGLAIYKGGNNAWTLSGTNTFSGRVTVSIGYLLANHPAALGVADDTVANRTEIFPGGTLVIGANLGAERLIVDGSGHSGNGALQSSGNYTLAGTVVLASGSVAMNLLAGQSLRFDGVVTGPGRFGMGNDGTYILANPGNDWVGAVQWGATGSQGSTLRLGASNAVPVSKSLTIPAPGIFDLNGFNQTLVSIGGTGTVALGAGGATLTLTDASGTMSGIITGAGNVVVSAGDLTLTGANTWTGLLTNSGATVVVNTGSVAANYNQTGGTLGISSGGTIGGAVTINAGGFSPGMGGLGNGNTGALTLAGGAVYNEMINGTTPGSFSSVGVSGAVNLGAATLSLVLAGGPYPVGTTWTIIANDLADPVIGAFAGIPQGGTVNAGGQTFRVSYTGGDGNDVVLTALTTTTTTLVSSVNPSSVGQNVAFTATVTPAGATGTVTFLDGVTPLGTVALVGGTAAYSTAALTAGTHTITAQYSGDATFAGSASAGVSQVVSALPIGAIPTLDWRMLPLLAAALATAALLAMKR